MKSQNIPGLSLVVTRDGQIVKSAGYGLANRQLNIPASPETVYKIGSVSKQFIATGIMLLVQEGRLRVEDPVGKHLDGSPLAWSGITVRHLLTHTSGLIREAPGFDPFKIQNDADVIRSAYSQPLRFAPGEKWEYSNLGYFTLAEIIRVVTGGPWSEDPQQDGVQAVWHACHATDDNVRADTELSERLHGQRPAPRCGRLACGSPERRLSLVPLIWRKAGWSGPQSVEWYQGSSAALHGGYDDGDPGDGGGDASGGDGSAGGGDGGGGGD